MHYNYLMHIGETLGTTEEVSCTTEVYGRSIHRGTTCSFAKRIPDSWMLELGAWVVVVTGRYWTSCVSIVRGVGTNDGGGGNSAIFSSRED